mgnify:CR=1 FL=1
MKGLMHLKKFTPNFMMKITSLLDSSMKPTFPTLGHDDYLNTDQTKNILAFTPTNTGKLI